MAKCVVIEVGDDGAVSVGAIPPGQYGNALKPAASLDDALAAARGALAGGEEQQPGAEVGPVEAAEGEAAFARGFERGPAKRY